MYKFPKNEQLNRQRRLFASARNPSSVQTRYIYAFYYRIACIYARRICSMDSVLLNIQDQCAISHQGGRNFDQSVGGVRSCYGGILGLSKCIPDVGCGVAVVWRRRCQFIASVKVIKILRDNQRVRCIPIFYLNCCSHSECCRNMASERLRSSSHLSISVGNLDLGA